MGYSFNGVCYDNGSKAHQAFMADFPKVDNGLVELLNSSSITGTPPTLSYSVRATDFGDGSVRTISGSLQFNTCDVGTMESFPVQSLMVLAAFAFAAIHGFKTGYRP